MQAVAQAGNTNTISMAGLAELVVFSKKVHGGLHEVPNAVTVLKGDKLSRGMTFLIGVPALVRGMATGHDYVIVKTNAAAEWSISPVIYALTRINLQQPLTVQPG